MDLSLSKKVLDSMLMDFHKDYENNLYILNVFKIDTFEQLNEFLWLSRRIFNMIDYMIISYYHFQLNIEEVIIQCLQFISKSTTCHISYINSTGIFGQYDIYDNFNYIVDYFQLIENRDYITVNNHIFITGEVFIKLLQSTKYNIKISKLLINYDNFVKLSDKYDKDIYPNMLSLLNKLYINIIKNIVKSYYD